MVLAGMLTLAFNVLPVVAEGAIYIRADGSIDPPTAPIASVDNVTYIFTDNIYDYETIVILANNIVIDGNGYTLQGAGVYASEGITLGGRSNVTIRNTNIDNYFWAILAWSSNHIRIVGNNITNNTWTGIRFSVGSSNNTISGNNIANNYRGVSFGNSSNNTVHHNNFINNTQHVYYESGSIVWDDGYPSGGNYWSDYSGVDVRSGPGQDLPGSDGIGDTPYVIDENNQDNYPLIEPWKRVAGVLEIFEPAQGATITGNVAITFKIENTGDFVEFLQGDSSSRIDLEIEYRSTGGEPYGWGIMLWSTADHGLTLHSGEKYEQTLIYDPSEYEEAVPPSFIGDAPYGQATIRLVHWKQMNGSYGYGEFGICETDITLLPSPQVLTATIDFHPHSLNLKSRGKWITAYIELPQGYDVADINVSSIMLNNTVQAKACPTKIRDHDCDKILELMVKFDREEVIQYILSSVNAKGKFTTVALTLTGKLEDGTPFEGTDNVKIIMPPHHCHHHRDFHHHAQQPFA